MARGCQASGDSVAAMDAYMALAAKKDRLSKVCVWVAAFVLASWRWLQKHQFIHDLLCCFAVER